MDKEMRVRMHCHHDGHLFGGIFMILVGSVFLLGQFSGIPVGRVFATYWPVFLIAIGALKLLRVWNWRRDIDTQH